MDNEVQNETEEAIHTEQQKVVLQLKKALDFFENVQIKNEEFLQNVKKSLDDILSSLKYVPVAQGSCFNDLPVEIKTHILNYSCDKGAFVVAAVCKEWKSILEPRLVDLKYITVGKCCWKEDGLALWSGCEEGNCFMPQELMTASAVLGLDIPLEVCYPVTNVDSSLLVQGLTSVSDFKIINDCSCREDDEGRLIADGPILNRKQTKDLFGAIEKETAINSVEIRGLDMTHLDQDKLIHSLFKIKNLKLAEDYSDEPQPILDFELFVEKLLEAPNNLTNFNLLSLHLENMQYPQNLNMDLANALCKVKSVIIGHYVPLRSSTVKQIVENILNGGVTMKSLEIIRELDWRSLITPDDLTKMMTHLEKIQLCGRFSREQVHAVKALAGVDACKRRAAAGRTWVLRFPV